MKSKFGNVFLALCIFALALPLQAQQRPTTGGAIVNALKVGQWVKFQGVPRPDQSVTLAKIKLVTGDFKDDDWQVFGPARALDAQKKEFMILFLRIKVSDTAEYSTDAIDKEVKNFADLRSGMLLEAEGTFLKDGIFLAADITDQTASTDAEDANEVEFFGKIEKIDAVKRTITMMGVTFHITDATKLKSAVK
ncbi:MAG: DUF5666 domain-containing protein [candidate division KSB1 bacterium]